MLPMNTNMRNREALMRKIQEVDFALYETTLYLDTHPHDEKALALHKEYAEASKNLKKHYNEMFGPLTPADNMSDKWEWVCGPWPWEM